MKLIAATKNKGKIKEIESMLSGSGIEVISQADAGIDIEAEENGKTFEENAVIKAEAVWNLNRTAMVLADDSGLCVDALGGAPGIYSARWAGEGASDKDKYMKLLRELKGEKNRSAYFATAMALKLPSGEVITTDGRVYGEITQEPDGEGGFGYDPVFFCPELGKTFAAATAEEKNSVSHRSRALAEMCKKIKAL